MVFWLRGCPLEFVPELQVPCRKGPVIIIWPGPGLPVGAITTSVPAPAVARRRRWGFTVRLAVTRPRQACRRGRQTMTAAAPGRV
jgi:hypothetical protein